MKNIISEIKGFFVKLGVGLSSVCKYIHSHPILEYFVFTTLIYLIVEILSRRSFIAPFAFIIDSPFIALFNFLIVAFTMSLSLAFRHRFFFYMMNVTVWLAIAIANFVIRCMRQNPFSAVDFTMAVNAFEIIPRYIGWFGVILVIAAFIIAGILLVILWRHCPQPVKFNRLRSAAATLFVTILLGSCIYGTISTNYIPAELESAVKAYNDYGFSYCFFRSFVHRGVVSPDEYTEEKVAELMDKLGETKESKTAENSPNVVFLQLESFFDVNKVKELKLTENPIPVFTSLKENNPHGKFSVNAIGGGTANTEFEVLCGMNLAHFGLLECPYTTILCDTQCQSTASVLRDVGYSTHAIHNHVATFYSRYLVYPNLGFDTFTTLEYMKDYEQNLLGWAKDDVLVNEIENALTSTEGKDFVFTVSVQPHGKYPNYETATEDDINLIAFPNEEKFYQVEYYVNQLRETDAMVQNVIDFLSDYPEDVVLVIYGDHLPTIGLEAEDMFDGDVYSTEYIIWSNCGFECEAGDIQAFQLSAKILNALGITGGEMFRIHNQLQDDENYHNDMQLLEYDMLKGENYALGENVPKPTEIKLGTQDISVSSMEVYDDIMFVYGTNFTKSSYIFINNLRYETIYINDTQLLAKDVELNPNDEIYVAQICEDSTLLSQTNSIIHNPEEPGISTEIDTTIPSTDEPIIDPENAEETGTAEETSTEGTTAESTEIGG